MATFLRLYPKPYTLPKSNEVDFKSFYIDPGMSTEQVEQRLINAAEDEEIVLRIVLRDLPFPVPLGFRKRDWSAWMVHEMPEKQTAAIKRAIEESRD